MRRCRLDDQAQAYRDALDRLLNGSPTHPAHVGKKVRVTASAVAREARKSRNPLYAQHHDILEEVVRAASAGGDFKGASSRTLELEREVAKLRSEVGAHATERRKLASENLTLLHRVQVAEERLAAVVRQNLSSQQRRR